MILFFEDGSPSYNVGKRYELKSDMTFNIYSKGASTPDETGKWKLKNGAVHLIFYYPNDGGYDYEDPDIMKILEISSAKLVWGINRVILSNSVTTKSHSFLPL